MDSPDSIAKALAGRVGSMDGGSLCFWGKWFGRPLDNCHNLVRSVANESQLTLYFDDSEKLSILEPFGFEMTNKGFKLQHAKHISWNWFYYGKPKTPNNWFTWDFEVVDRQVVFRSTWPNEASSRTRFDYPAVEWTTP